MEPRMTMLAEKKLIGKCIQMSFAENKTGELWRSFMPVRKQILNPVSEDLYALQVYDPLHFDQFDPHRQFEKWALMEVANFDYVPKDMMTFTLSGGLYAVFLHRGSSTDNSTFDYIFNQWLPTSPYCLDARPHFELLGSKYKNADPDSEEEIWIPVRPK